MADTGVKTYTFHHAELGPMTGLVLPDNVVQFRAVPYATVPARFKKSILLDHLPEKDKPYTKHGFASPQIFPPRDFDGGPFPGDPEVPPSDEFQCLILQLNIPLSLLQAPNAAKLPVLVYIHGGGFILGRIDNQHNTALMVSQSIDDGKPVIAASIQYRLGALGYLHTPSSGNANLALKDQRNALLWIQKFIAGFGGDARRVTVFGESAGSMSICAHLLAPPPPEGPLFTRAILMSGPLGPASAPAPLRVGEERYEAFLRELGISERGEEGLKKVSEVDIGTLVTTSAQLGEDGGLWLSVQDKDFFGPDAESITWDRIPELIGNLDWINDIMLGCTSFEALTFSSRYLHITPPAFIDSLTKLLGPSATSVISRTYNITPETDKVAFHNPFLRFLGDTVFDAGTHMLASHLSSLPNKNIYRWVFDVRNPFPGHALFLQPHHWVDIYFVFRAHQFRYGEERLRGISDEHARLWVAFANGEEPWTPYVKGEEVVMVADEKEGWVQKRREVVESELGWGYARCEGLIRAWEVAGLKGAFRDVFALECLAGTIKT